MLKIGKIKISKTEKPKIIAEISGNHNRNINRALKLIRLAAKHGADFVKIQTYTPENLTINSSRSDFIIRDKKSLWNKKKLFDLYKIGQTPLSWHKKLIREAKKSRIVLFSSVFDEYSLKFLEKLNMPAYKIASFESNHYPLIEKVIKTRKPILISTGLNTLKETNELVKFLKKKKCKNFALLKCTSSYPADPNDANILTINDMRKRFRCEIGLSDHTLGIGTSISAINHGATFIEKHFTLDNKDGGIDSKFSLNPIKLKDLIEETYNAWQSVGKIFYGPTKNEINSLKFRRSIYSTKNIKKGEKFTDQNIKVVRPGYGLKPKFYNNILGKISKIKISTGTAINWKMIK